MRRFSALHILLFAATRCYAYLDLYSQTDLNQVIRDKSKDGHIMLFTYVSGLSRMWSDMSLELCLQLNERHYPYVVLTHDAASCDDLVALASGRVDPPPTCVLNSVLHKTRGYANTVLTLWVRRYHAAALFAEAGVSVTLLDADTLITRDFVPVLRRLEREYALIALGEGPINGGLWHLRASNRSSAALWVIKQVERRTTLLEKFKVHDRDHDPGVHMDQDELGDALRVASDPHGSAFDFWNDFKDSRFKDHEIWQRFPQKQPTRGFQWLNGLDTISSPWLPDTCEWEAYACARFENFATKYELRNAPTRYANICVPFDSEQFDETAPCEKVLNAPMWLFSHGDPLVNGFVDQIAVYHLLGVNLYWSDKGSGSHVSRYAQWLARPGMKTYRERHTGAYLRASRHLVERACEHSDISHMRFLVKHLFERAASNGSMPVLPSFPCTCKWVIRGDASFLGFEDHRVVDDGAHCHPSTAGFDSCFPGDQYTYDFLVPPGARVETLDGVVHDSIKSTHGTHINEVRRACPEFLEIA